MLRSKQYWVLIILSAISLLIRLVFLAPMTSNHAGEFWDAQGYFQRAIGFEHILISLLQGDKPSTRDLAQAYNTTWPPLQSFLLSLGYVVFGHSLLIGRLMMVTLSVLTTPFVYLVTKKLSNDRVAFLAALIFATYPSFIHYSLRLFSETTYIFLSFLMFYCALLTVEATTVKKAGLLAAATGCLLGLATLTRGAGLLWIPTVALWVGWRSIEFSKRLLVPVIVLMSAGLTLLPWEVALFATEGRVIMVTTSSDLNLYVANNPWLPDGYGIAGEVVKPHIKEAAAEYSQQHKVDTGTAYRALALQEIRGDPVKFIKRGFYKWRATWQPDFQLYRYLVVLGYPPMSTGWLSLIFLVMLSSFCLFLAFALWGLFNPTPALRYREFVVALVLVTMATYMITLGHARFSIPLLAVLLPAAGHGLTYLRAFLAKNNRPWALVTLGSITSMGVSIYTGLYYEYSRTAPSSQYVHFIRHLDPWLGYNTTVSDQLLFRTNGDAHPGEVIISAVGRDFAFVNSTSQTYTWDPSTEAGALHVVVQSQTATEPLQLQVTLGQSGQAALVSLKRAVWQAWQPTGLPGIEYMWIGSAGFPIEGTDEPAFNE